jgi:hypothetical protein
VKVPAGTVEYQESLKKAKATLIRLNKGSKMLEEAILSRETLQAEKIIRHWEKLARELFVELEIATLIHQQNLTGNSVVAKADGTPIKIEEIMDTKPVDIDPWTLISLEKLKTVFGEDVHNFIKIS